MSILAICAEWWREVLRHSALHKLTSPSPVIKLGRMQSGPIPITSITGLSLPDLRCDALNIPENSLVWTCIETLVLYIHTAYFTFSHFVDQHSHGTSGTCIFCFYWSMECIIQLLYWCPTRITLCLHPEQVRSYVRTCILYINLHHKVCESNRLW